MSHFLRHHSEELLKHYGSLPLTWQADGTPKGTVAEAYIPLLTNYTQEDKEAKGLRRIENPEAPRPAIHFSALEMIQENRFCLLFGKSGGGKTSLALNLALNLAGECMNDARYRLKNFERNIPRNDKGFARPEHWTLPSCWPILVSVQLKDAWENLQERFATCLENGHILLIVDGLEKFSDPELALSKISELLKAFPQLRTVILADAFLCEGLFIPGPIAQFSLLDLNAAQQQNLHTVESSKFTAPLRPDLFVAATSSELLFQQTPCAQEITEKWLRTLDISARCKELQDAALAYQLGKDSAFDEVPERIVPFLRSDLARTVLFPVLTARALSERAEKKRLALLFENPVRWKDTIPFLGRSLEKKQNGLKELVITLLAYNHPSGLGLLASADIVLDSTDIDVELQQICRDALMAAIDADVLPLTIKDKIAQRLARLGDTRNFNDMVPIPAGLATIGSDTHPNSSPAHQIFIDKFLIGRVPVTNAQYSVFVQKTRRHWPSPEADRPERATAPATDVTWYDATAYCAWLTQIWRKNGFISTEMTVRLPTESEWEWAARGTQQDVPGEVCYPWGRPWRWGVSNSAELGINAPVAVGLSRAGRSPFGIDDMVGQVWEWTQTLWGTEMARPDYPYSSYPAEQERQDDGPSIRRVLRGGCFSSPRLKASCTYRGSLEPTGFWRGNGFRIVVS